MSEMIERIARILADINNYPKWKPFESDARLIFEAIREPTEEMLDAGYDAICDAEPSWAGTIFRAMIDAALKDKTETTSPSHDTNARGASPKDA